MTVASLAHTWNRATERIEERARKITFRQVLIFVIAAIPFAVCFSVYFAWKILWTALTWIGSAGIEGWVMARDLEARRAAKKRGEPWVS